MTALAKARLTNARQRTLINLRVAASVLCYAGGLAVLDASGNVKPGVAGTGLKGLGRFKDTVDNSSGDAGDLNADVELGVFQFGNSASADEITAAEIGTVCYVVDDQTVAKTSNSGARSIAGLVCDVDGEGVWVDFTIGAAPGVNTYYLRGAAISTKASDAAVSRVVVPKRGTVTKIWTVLNAALATGDATLTAKIGATGITGGVITATQSGSAAGDVDSATPSAANTVVAGDVLSLTGGGASTATATAEWVAEITY